MDLVQQFELQIPNWSDEERADALKVIEGQIEMTLASANQAARHAHEGLSLSYRSMWEIVAERRRVELMELERIKVLLGAT